MFLFWDFGVLIIYRRGILEYLELFEGSFSLFLGYLVILSRIGLFENGRVVG